MKRLTRNWLAAVVSILCVVCMAFALTACTGGNDPVKLDAPVITLDGDVISWQPVAHADGYIVLENDIEMTTVTASPYTIPQVIAGTYSYTVKATSNDKGYTTSDASNAVSYVVGEGEPAEGTQENPYVIDTFKTYVAETTEVQGFFGPEVQPVYFTFTVTTNMTLYFSAGDDTQLQISYVGDNDVPVSKTVSPDYNEIPDGWELTAGTVLMIEVGNVGWEAGLVEFTISNQPIDNPADGTQENPYVIDMFKTYVAETTEVQGFFGPEVQPVYFTFTVTANMTLYFSAGDDTQLQISYVGANDVPVSKTVSPDYNEIPDGWELTAGTVLMIEVGNVGWEAGLVEFTISNQPINNPADGTQENPYVIDTFKTYVAETTEVQGFFGPEVQPVYFTFTVPTDMTLYFSAGEDTQLQISYVEADDVPVSKTVSPDYNEIPDGWELTAGTVLMIEVGNVGWEAGLVEFTISNLPIENAPEGTQENPYVIDEFKTYTAETTEVQGFFGPEVQPVYFTFTVTENMTLYFSAGEDTVLQISYVGANDVPVSKTVSSDDNEIPDGWALSAGLVITIEVSNAGWEAGPVEFTISNTPIAD